MALLRQHIPKPGGYRSRSPMLSVWSETASSVPQPVDFGWRLHGRTVYLLHDSSLTLLPHRQRATAALLAQYCPDANSLLSCLQCGACTVNCHLAETNGASFPRRQMTLLQLGEVDRLVTDPSVWLCFNCQDCTSRCPANAGPGRIMAAIRRLAVEHYSVPHWLSRSINQRRGFLRMLLAAITLVLLAIARGGSFSPQITPVRYASMFPHFALNLFFGTLAAMVTISAAVNTARAWKAFTGEAPAKTSLGRVLESLVFATRQIARHRQFSECQQFRLSRWAHIAVLYGFMTLLMLAGAAAAMIALGASYPLPVLHPFKIAGNLAAVLIIVGSLYFCVQRARLSQGREACAWFDWAPLVQLLLVSTTGLLAELFRYANLGRLAYPAYFLHLIFVFVLLAGFANSKLAHVFYRTIALTAEQYKTVSDASTADLRPRRMAA